MQSISTFATVKDQSTSSTSGIAFEDVPVHKRVLQSERIQPWDPY